MDTLTVVLFVIGLGLLIAGAELLVKGSSRLARAIGISPLVIGLTVVAFGTSSPEMAVSVSTAMAGRADLAVGNVVGSNIFNVLFILGVSALITPLIVNQQLIRLDVPIMIGASVLVYLLALDGVINRLEGILLFAGIVAYTAFLIVQSRKENKKDALDKYAKEYSDGKPTPSQTLLNLAFIAAGLAMLVAGSNWLVNGAVALARTFGVDELVIGLTIVAAGTSLPEVATSILAAIRKERDIAVGNVVGSNIFNIFAVLGVSSAVAPQGLVVSPAAIAFDIPVMIAVAIACLPIFLTGNEISRWKGALFLAYYVAYTVYLIFNASSHAALPMFSNVMLYFAIPLTVLTLGLAVARDWRTRRASAAH